MADLFFPSGMATFGDARSGQLELAGALEKIGFDALTGFGSKGEPTPGSAGPFNSFATMATVG